MAFPDTNGRSTICTAGANISTADTKPASGLQKTLLRALRT
jgi:hypothetical protein